MIKGVNLFIKIKKIITKIEDNNKLTKILKFLIGQSESIQSSKELSPNYMIFFKYISITSVDVEMSL